MSLLVFPLAPSLSASALSLAKAFPMLLLKMLILPRRFEKLVLYVAHAAGELCLQVLLHLFGMRTLELLQVLPRRGMNSFLMSLPSLSMSMPLNKWFAQLDLFPGMILPVRSQFSVLGDQTASAMRSCFLEICPSVKACLCNPWSFCLLRRSSAETTRMSMHCNCVTSTVCVPVCATGPWRCICRKLTDFDNVAVRRLASCYQCVAFNMCAGNIHLPNTCFIVFKLSAPLLGSSSACTPPRDHPCAR